jgi:hypothetical protein
MARERRVISNTLLGEPPSGNWHPVWMRRGPEGICHCYHHIEVKPQSIGRVLGIGLRVAGRVASQHMSGQQAAEPSGQNAAPKPQPDIAARASAAGQKTRGVARGFSGFLKPFRTVGGKIWLEVTGAFFFLPVLAFAPVLWKTRGSWQQGPDHRTFLSAAVIIVVFSYLGVSSFWRAGRRR